MLSKHSSPRLPAFTAILLACFLAAPAGGPSARADAGDSFIIKVVDDATGRGVPMVELRTTSQTVYITDSNGIAAFQEPALLGQKVFFTVSSHGYEFPADGFGYRGKALQVERGGKAELRIRRINIAERLYRVTGEGIYRDSIIAGEPAPLRRPLLNGLVTGSDSVVNAVYRGKIYWFWGDTNRPAYPLGLFNVPGATSLLPEAGGLDPAAGVDFEYFTGADGFARAMAPMPGEGPTWIFGLVTLPESSGRERMFAAYIKVRGSLDVYQHGLCEYNPEKDVFEKAAQFDEGAPVYPGGHPFRLGDGDAGSIYFPLPFPATRVRATADALRDLAAYESLSCLQEGSRPEDRRIDRTASGLLRYSWKRRTPPVTQESQEKLLKAGVLRAGESLFPLQDAESGKPVRAHGSSVYWNGYRKRWVMIAVEAGGSSYLGEVWFAEADAPAGPWVYARKVLTHEKYSFYNPKQHPMFDREGGRFIFFEGTYTHTFSGSTAQTPRYDYNQMMHRLDLDDPRLILPVPVYRAPPESIAAGAAARLGSAADFKSPPPFAAIAFFALDRPRPGSVPIRIGGREAFHGLPVDGPAPPAAVPLFELVHESSGERDYTADPGWKAAGFKRSELPVCRVWRNPFASFILEN